MTKYYLNVYKYDFHTGNYKQVKNDLLGFIRKKAIEQYNKELYLAYVCNCEMIHLVEIDDDYNIAHVIKHSECFCK